MSNATKTRLVWFDANRVCAAIGVVLIHSSTDFGGKAFPDATQGERFIPVFFRSIGEFSGSEMFFMFSFFLLAMRVDRKMPTYGNVIHSQFHRLLIPFFFWAIFFAFFRLLKADSFNYAPYIWGQISELKNWAGYMVLGNSQYHMHFLPTLFAVSLFYPVMRIAMRYPIFGLTIVVSLGVMNNIQSFLWGLEMDGLLRDFLIRTFKVFGYVGYGMAAFAFYGLWKDGIPRGESRLIRKCGFYFVILAYIATIPFFYGAFETGEWKYRVDWSFYGHFLMPIFVFSFFIGGQYLKWSPQWSKFMPYSFGVYLLHPVVIDLFDISIFKLGIYQTMSPAMIVVARFAFALPATFALAIAISRFKPLAWTIGLGPNPLEKLELSKLKTV